MGLGQSGPSRTVTIENEDAVINISDEVVQRLKGQHQKSKSKYNLTLVFYFCYAIFSVFYKFLVVVNFDEDKMCLHFL